MNNSPAPIRRWFLRLGQFLFLACLALNLSVVRADDASPATASAADATNNPDADKAWKEVRKATQPPMPPAEWQNKKPSREEAAAFYIKALHDGADKARDFYTRFPNDPRAVQARKKEYNALNIAVQRFGDDTQNARIEAIEANRMKDPNLGEDERFALRFGAASRLAEQLPDKLDELVKAAKTLQKDYPDRQQVYQLYFFVAMQAGDDATKTMAQQVIDGPAPDEAKDQARGLLKKAEALGKPLDIQYTAVDGREVDISKLKGKVVLVDFWATWCGPCVGELPHVKAAYSKLHDQGFEIVGISFDQEKEKLTKFVAENEMAWPQYFDGEGWGNKFGKEYGINSIPAMWLVDKKGNLRDLNGRADLEGKVTKLLAE